MRLASLGATLIAALAATTTVCARDEPQDWLARMAQATAVEYRGVLVYIHDGRVESMQIARVMGPNGPREHVVSLSGERREVVREGNELRCVTGGGATTVVNSVRPSALTIDPSALGAARHYRLSIAGEDRVAGHASVVLVAAPADDTRYGYRLWLERETGLLVGSTLLDGEGDPVEQLMFTSLDLRPSAAAEFSTGTDRAAARATTAPRPRAAIRATGLPGGFELVAARGEPDARRQFVYTDGIASVSIYVEPLVAGAHPLLGATRRGAINAFGRAQDGVRVLVIGDLPAPTVERIAMTVDPSVLSQ